MANRRFSASLTDMQTSFDFNIDLPVVEPKFCAHSETSKAAAVKAQRTVGKAHKEIVKYLAHTPNKSADQIAASVGASFMNYRPRMNELVEHGLVVKTGDDGVTFFGNSQESYSLTAEGKQLANKLNELQNEFIRG